MVDNLGHVGGLAAGLWLGYTMGPRFAVTRELDIPEVRPLLLHGAGRLLPGSCCRAGCWAGCRAWRCGGRGQVLPSDSRSH
jgi:hypothetical protein